MCNFHPLEGVDRGSETHLQVGENLNYLIKRFIEFKFKGFTQEHRVHYHD